MMKLNIFKLRFCINDGPAADLIAAVNIGTSEKNAKNILVKELYGNYIADNKLNYDESVLQDSVKRSIISKIGILEPEDPLLEEVDDFSFIMLHRCPEWNINR